MLGAAHRLGLRVIGDLVVNHTSDQHPWFQAAVGDPTGPYRPYYIWRDPAPGGGPPNNWPSHFGGSAWTLDRRSGQYYLHLFRPKQPDLNWRHPAVADEVDAIIEHWLSRELDGFRAVVGFALLWTVSDPAVATAGLFLAGVGIALLYPVTLAEALAAWSANPAVAAARCALASGIAIGAAPLLLGALADLAGLRAALLLVPTLLGTIAARSTVRLATTRVATARDASERSLP